MKRKERFFGNLLSLVLMLVLMAGMSLTAYAATSHDIRVYSGQNGSVRVEVNGTTVTSAEEGATVTLTAIPANGYRLASISGICVVRSLEETLNCTGSTVSGKYFNLVASSRSRNGDGSYRWNLYGNSTIKITSKVTEINISRAEFNINYTMGTFNYEMLSVDRGNVSFLNNNTISVSSVNSNEFTLTGTGRPQDGRGGGVGSVTIYGSGNGEIPLTITQSPDSQNVYTFTMPAGFSGSVWITPAFELIPTHTHSFSYSVDGATITATCGSVVGDCDYRGGIPLTISAPNRSWDGFAKGATITGNYPDPAPAGLADKPTAISYEKVENGGSTPLTNAPIAVGEYKASFTWGDKTASVLYNITEPADNACGDGLTWAYDDGTQTLTISYSGSGTGRMYNYSNEETGSTRLPPWSNIKGNIENLVIAEGATTISSYAFSGCTSLSTATIPNSVTDVGDNCFSDCTELTTVTVQGTLWNSMSNMFKDCSKLECIYCNETTYEKLKVNNNLDGTPLQNDQFPHVVKVRANRAAGGTVTGGGIFSKNVSSIHSATVTATPATGYSFLYWTDVFDKVVTADSPYTFEVTKDQTLKAHFAAFSGTCGNNLTWAVTDEDGDGTCETLTISGTGDMEGYSIDNANDYSTAPWGPHTRNITTLIIGKDVTSIGDYAFYHFTNLSSLTIGDGSQLTKIGSGAFDKCQKLTSFTIPDEVTTIGMAAFNECGFTSVRIGDKVENFDAQAFLKCENLTYIDCTKTAWENNIKGAVENTQYQQFDQTPFYRQGWYVDVSSAGDGTVTGRGAYANNTPANVKAIPEQGKVFAYWTDENGNIVKDNDGKRVGAVYNLPATNNVSLTAHFHLHDFTYSTSGAAITATCNADGCTLDDGTEQHKHAVTLTIVKPTLTTYGQTGEGISAEATLDGLENFNTATGLNVQTSSIVYWNAKIQEGVYKTDGDQPLTAAPTSAGNYLAKITVNNCIAAVGYTIAKADPTANAPTGLTATYGQTLANVSLEGKNPEGNTPGTWAWADAATTSVGSVGVRTFKANFTPTDTTNYNSKSNVDVTVTVGKADPTAPTGLTATYGQSLANVTLPDGWTWADSTQSVGNVVDPAATFKANFAGNDNYNAASNVDVSVTVGKADVTAPTIASKAYTGRTQTADVAASTLYSVTANNGGTNVGSYDVVLTLTDSANYKWTDSTEAAKTLSFRITKATANTVTVSIEGWTYGEAAKAPTSTATFGTAEYTYAVKGRTDFSAAVPTNAGEYTVKAAVADTADYPAGEATADFTIARATITPTVSITGWTVGETANTPGVAGNTGDGAVTYSYAVKGSADFSAAVPTDAGEYTVKASIAETANYNGAEATADFTIAKKIPAAGVDFTVEALQLTYTGVRKELVRQTILTDGLEIKYSFDNGASVETGLPMKKASGVYQICYRVIGNDIYETLGWSGPVTATITMYATFSEPDFALPPFLAEIGEEAFAEDMALTTVDAGSCAKIGANAFRGCTNLKRIRLSQNCEIDDTAFTGCMALKIFAPAGGTTAAWCAGHNINFVAE